MCAVLDVSIAGYRAWQKKWLRWIETQTATICANDLIALGA